MSKYELIALDMDGTLLNTNGVVSPYTTDVINRATEKGVHVVLCTGRPLPMCASFYDELRLSSFIITSNGAEIWNQNKTLLHQFPLSAERIEQLWHFGHEHHYHMWMVASGAIFPNSSRPDNFRDYTWLKFGYGNLTPNDKRFILNNIETYTDLEITNSSEKNIEINKRGVHKAKALQIICEKLNISMEQVIAMGDSLNDYKMIERAGLGIAVKNAQRSILEIADYVTKSNNDDGVALAIEKFVLA